MLYCRLESTIPTGDGRGSNEHADCTTPTTDRSIHAEDACQHGQGAPPHGPSQDDAGRTTARGTATVVLPARCPLESCHATTTTIASHPQRPAENDDETRHASTITARATNTSPNGSLRSFLNFLLICSNFRDNINNKCEPRASRCNTCEHRNRACNKHSNVGKVRMDKL